ncbi:MAG: SMP-30/gluconolactonase/LRE family protein [Puniceicoccaceae bacterium]
MADDKGNLYISLRCTEEGRIVSNQLVKVLASGELSVITDLGAIDPGMSGILGLAVDSDGYIYCAFPCGDERHGIWRISPTGEKERLSGSERIVMPNAIALDGANNVYVTDSDPFEQGQAGVWVLTRETGSFEPWCHDPLVRSDPANPNGGLPLPGANGIAFVPPNHLYVANTEKSLIAEILIREDGKAGEVSLVAGNSHLLTTLDGLIADAMGYLYTVIPIATVDLSPEMGGPLPPMSPVVRINLQDGQIEPLLDVHAFPDKEYFDFPTSLSLRSSSQYGITVFVSSMGSVNYNFPPGTGAKLTRLEIGNASDSCEE